MRLPIRARLTLVSGVLMTGVVAALGAFLYLSLRAGLLEAVDNGLRARAEVLVGGSGPDRSLTGSTLAEPDDAFAQWLWPDGRVLSSSEGIPGTPVLPRNVVAGLDGVRFFETEIRASEEDVPARLLAVPSGDAVLVVGASLEDQRDALARLLVLLATGGPVAVALASGVGWLVAGAALRPMERMRSEAEAVSASEPGRRLQVPATGDELARLGETLNQMLDRLEDAVERERRLIGDASHELRTPLANLRAELELALSRARTPEELVAAVRSAAEETDRLGRLAEDLLVLAQAGGGRLPIRREDVQVQRLIQRTVAPFTGLAAQSGVTLITHVDRTLWSSVDGIRVGQAVGNLIDNALRHTPPGGQVIVRAAARNGALSIEVTDTGSGFDPSFLPQALEPFSRPERARARNDGGAGLGLAIVRSVAEAHGGTVEVGNRPEGGARVVLRIRE